MNGITNEILECVRCGNSNPFFFYLKQQKIMLITASSTLQTNYLPLTHVRFMRNMLYYFFGLQGVSESGLMHLVDPEGIYWTSFNKCYDREFLKAAGSHYKMDKFSRTTCGEVFLQKEYNELNPSLVIVMGKATCDAVRLLINKNNLKICCQIEYCDYFYTEPDEELIHKIRAEIAETLDLPCPTEKYQRQLTSTSATNSKVHLTFQRNIYNDIANIFDGSGNDDCFENTVEQYWIQNVVTPLKLRYYKFLEIWNSLENSVNASFMNIFDASNKLMHGCYHNSYSDRHNSGWFFSNWQSILEATGKTNMKSRVVALYERANVLRKLRNYIVHGNGRLTFIDATSEHLDDEVLSKSGFSEVLLFPNLIYITEYGIEQIDDFYNTMIDFLTALDH